MKTMPVWKKSNMLKGKIKTMPVKAAVKKSVKWNVKQINKKK